MWMWLKMNYSQLCCNVSLNFFIKVVNDVATESIHLFDYGNNTLYILHLQVVSVRVPWLESRDISIDQRIARYTHNSVLWLAWDLSEIGFVPPNPCDCRYLGSTPIIWVRCERTGQDVIWPYTTHALQIAGWWRRVSSHSVMLIICLNSQN